MLTILVLITPLLSEPFDLTVAETLSQAVSHDGRYISWAEHRIDDTELAGFAITGSDGLAMADLDRDGFEDIVSVHESDTVYDGQPIGHIRIAWGSANPNQWALTTLASGAEAAAAEDVSIADANGDGWPDVIAAAELAHLIYFENPGGDAGADAPRRLQWPRTIPPLTTGRGSFIRTFFADFDGDGKPEVVAPNKGDQNPAVEQAPLNNISIFHLPAKPLQGALWREQLLTRVRIPINSIPVDLDGDGDLDVVAGARAESRILWLRNDGEFSFTTHRIQPAGKPNDAALTGFNMDFADLDADGRMDIVSTAWTGYLLWLRAPATADAPWETHVIGNIAPDQLVSVRLADIDGDGDLDAFTGAYSAGPRDHDDMQAGPDTAAGRIAWFANPGPAALQQPWPRHDVSRRQRGMFDKWLARDLDGDGDLDFIGTRGNSEPYDGVIWLEQVRTASPQPAFRKARARDSRELPLPATGHNQGP